MQTFQQHLPQILNHNGIYSYFNGLCPRNVFFHAVCCEVVKLELEHTGFQVHFEGVNVESLMTKENNVHEEVTWKGIKDKYWFMDTYYVPICIFKKE